MKWAVAILLLSLIIDDSLCQHRHGGRRGNRPLRNRQRQGRVLAAQSPLGPPPQPAILLSSADPILLFNEEPEESFQEPIPSRAQVTPRQGRQQPFRRGRQFDTGDIQGSFPDAEGNYNFQYSSDDGSFRQENGLAGTKDGEVSWVSPEGEQITFSYVADENGYQASGSHVPQNVPLPDNLQIWQEVLQRG